MVLFAAVHLYWALGGSVGLPAGVSLFAKSALMFMNILAVPLSLAGAVVALALVRPWGDRVPRSVLLVAAWGTSAMLVVHAAPAFSEWIALALGAHPGHLSQADRFSLFLYEPYWLLGGILMGLAAWSSRS